MSARILVIEEDLYILSMMEIVLARLGHRPFLVQRAGDGLQMFGATYPDIVIAHLPASEPDAIVQIFKMKGLKPDAKIIAMSGADRVMSEDDLMHMAASVCADYVLPDPFDGDEIAVIVESALAQTAAELRRARA